MADRRVFLQSWISQSGGQGLAILNGNKISAYGYIRPAQVGFKVGPVFSENTEDGIKILNSLLSLVLNEQVQIDIPEKNIAAINFMEKINFHQVFGCARMVNGPDLEIPTEKNFMSIKTHPESNSIPVESYDIFKVMQLTRNTALENHVAVDWVSIAAHQKSNVHRHNFSETVIFIVSGSAMAQVGERIFPVKEGDQITIRSTEYHGFTTSEEALIFISIQSPPILNKATGVLDLDPLT